ncbi:MAG: hypothetical protein IIB38_13475, partial [Candidatus Hydrogenedentes bacterium]|nr:hypothetical protein [Candidatus Hydrogenedentota bacterium]
MKVEKRRVMAVLCFATLAMLISMPASAAKTNDAITFTRDILPVFQENCMVCHRPGGANLGGMVAPMAFTTYREVRPWAKAIARVVSTKRMPPWDAAPVHAGVFAGERVLTEEEIDLIVNWVDAGAPRGNPKDVPEAIEWPSVDGWSIG